VGGINENVFDRERGINMKTNEFVSNKKWYIILGVVFLAALVIITGVFVNIIFHKLDSMQKQNESLSASVDLLETSSETMRNYIDDLKQDLKTNSADQMLLSSLKSDLEEILAELLEFTVLNDNVKDLVSLKETLDQINNELKKMSSAWASAEPDDKAEPAEASENEIAAITDSELPAGNPAIPSGPSSEPENIIKAGNDFIVTVRADTVTDMYGYQFNLSFDKSKASYNSGLRSTINGIDVIFKKDQPDNLLIGATMTGDNPGYSGNDVNVCTLVFTANEDLDPSVFSISDVRTVDSKQNYVENVSGWSCEAKILE